MKAGILLRCWSVKMSFPRDEESRMAHVQTFYLFILNHLILIKSKIKQLNMIRLVQTDANLISNKPTKLNATKCFYFCFFVCMCACVWVECNRSK